jgi:hypothetical protein
VGTREHEADHSLPPNDEMRSYASSTLVCLHAMDRDNFTSLYFSLSVPQDLPQFHDIFSSLLFLSADKEKLIRIYDLIHAFDQVSSFIP